ncbi:MAG: hypothetical protein ACI4PQ_08205 [Butyricicoccaceae bacterium]
MLEHTLLWFGAALSLNGLAAGALMAASNLSALSLLVGQILGCILLGLGGRIGAVTGRNSMQCISLSLGRWPMVVVSVLGTVYQVGCISVTFAVAARAAVELIGGNLIVWCGVLGVLSLFWLYAGQRGRHQYNAIGVAVLVIVCLAVCLSYQSDGVPIPEKARSFAHGVWISAALPISCLPLAADSVSRQMRPRAAYWLAAIAFGMGSLIACSMGILVMNNGRAVLPAWLTVIYVVLSTLTTIYLYARSAGMALEQVFSDVPGKPVSLLAVIAGALIACCIPAVWFGDVFVIACAIMIPLFTILFMDFFVLHHYDTDRRVDWHNLILWAVCIASSLLLMQVTHFGELLTVVLTAALCFISRKIRQWMRN